MVEPGDLRRAIEKYGQGCNSFLALYRGFHTFRSAAGIAPYTGTRTAWVGVAEPLAEPVKRSALLDHFADAAARDRKAALFVPVGEATARLAMKNGYGAVKVGMEVKFDLTRYEPSPDRLPVARQIQNRGARVQEFRPETLPFEERYELDRIVGKWLASRKTVALGLHNIVDPWALHADKRYFRILHGGEVLAFVAANPVWSTRGWYLIDVMRLPHAPVGTVELLLLEAMRMLKADGALEISLGVAPLSGLESPPEIDPERKRFYRSLNWVYRRGGLIYNFSQLHQFKLKFEPTSQEDAYLIYFPARLGPAVAIGLMEAYFPGGFLHAAAGSLYQLGFRFKLTHWLDQRLSRALAFRPPAESLGVFFRRIRWTLFFTGLINGLYWLGPAGWQDRFAFGMPHLGDYAVERFLISPFLHWNFTHVAMNTLTLLIFCGLVEYLAGSSAMLVAFTVGAALSNPLTLLVLRGLSGVLPGLWNLAAKENDVGASLGIFACAGALPHLLRRAHWLALALIPLTIVYCLIVDSALSLNHLCALGIGFVAFFAWLRL